MRETKKKENNMNDPYVYPDTDVLINKLDIRDARMLQRVEMAVFYGKYFDALPTGNFDYSHLKAIHKHFFSQLYDWAGEQRTVNITKGDSHFAFKDYIHPEMDKISNKLKADNYLQDLNKPEFCKKLSFYFNEINAIHPFREGNGRTLRAFCDLLAAQSEYRLDWRRVENKEYIEASIMGFNGSYEAMEQMFAQIAQKTSLSKDMEIKLSDVTEKKLVDYIRLQLELNNTVYKKYILGLKDKELAKQLDEKAIQLDQRINALTKVLSEDPSFTKLLERSMLDVCRRKEPSIKEISERLNNGQISHDDRLAVLKHVKSRTISLSKTLNESRDRGGRSR